MGDFTTNGIKIGTCGNAYYATKQQLEKVKFHDQEIKSYLTPKNKCKLAFPYPEFDNKKVGEISIFHKPANELIVLEIDKQRRTYHKKITHHIHPSGGHGINLFCDCPYSSTENVSRNFIENNLKLYLKYQSFTGEGEKMAIIGECIYCGESNRLEEHEAQEAAANIIKQAECNERESNIDESIRLREIAKRIVKTYK